MALSSRKYGKVIRDRPASRLGGARSTGHVTGFAFGFREAASVTTSMAGTNNDLTLTAKSDGTGGNSIRFRIVVSGASTALSVSVSGNDITVNSATNAGSAATSTAAQVRDAINGNGPASALVTAALASGNDGTGVVAALGFTNLSGGRNLVAGR